MNSIKKTRIAKAAINLLCLGHAAETVSTKSNLWAQAQSVLTVEKISSLVPKIDDRSRRNASSLLGNLVISAHYGFYPALYLALAENSADKRVAAVIGDQPVEQAQALKNLANKNGVDIDFIKGGLGIIRETRNYLQLKRSAVLLLDVPWSGSAAPLDIWYPGPDGDFGSLRNLLRLPQLIDPHYKQCFVNEVGGHYLFEYSTGSDDGVFNFLTEKLQNEPQFYERLDSFERYFRFSCLPNGGVIFPIGLNTFFMSVIGRRIWDLTKACNAGALKIPASGIIANHDLSIVCEVTGQSLDFAVAI